MNIRFSIVVKRTFLFLIVFLSVATVFSCKKNNDAQVKLYMTGKVHIKDYPIFISVKDTVTFRFGGIIHPEKKPIGMYFRINDIMTKSDTVYWAVATEKHPSTNPLPPFGIDTTFSYIFPDTLGNFTVTVTEYPSDPDRYYTSYNTVSISTVDRYESLPEVNVDYERDFFTDLRDGTDYNFIKAGDVYWMQQNLAYEGLDSSHPHSVGRPYYNAEDVSGIFGRFYTWDEAVNDSICPPGWRLPTDGDWAALALSVNPSGTYIPGTDYRNVAGPLMVDAFFNGDKMWEFWPEVNVAGKDDSVLKIIPMGICNAARNEDFSNILEYACFWTSDSSDGNGLYRYIYKKENDLKAGYGDKSSLALTVRCVIDTYPN